MAIHMTMMWSERVTMVIVARKMSMDPVKIFSELISARWRYAVVYMAIKKNTVLVIAAHPDDEVLGAGGTIAWHANNGDDVYVLFITEGCSTQYKGDDVIIDRKKREANRANAILGVKDIFFEDLPDMRLDSLLHIEVNGVIEKYIAKTRPNIVFSHHPDINKDHVVIFVSFKL